MIYISLYWYFLPIGIAIINFIIGSVIILSLHILIKANKLSKDVANNKISKFFEFQTKLISQILPKVFLLFLICLMTYRISFRIYDKIKIQKENKIYNISKLKNYNFNYYKINYINGKDKTTIFIVSQNKLIIKDYLKINDNTIIYPTKIEKVSFDAFIDSIINRKITNEEIDFIIKGRYNETTL